jgi:hypothetical protein
MDDLIDIIIKYRWEIAGALAMAFIVAYLAGLNNRLNRLAIASTTFRNTILTELKGLYPIPSDWPKDINMLDQRLRQVFPNLQIAVANFRPFVPWYWRWTFDRAWRIYRLGKDGREIDRQLYHQYISFSDNPNYKENFKHNVDKLLSYAKQK